MKNAEQITVIIVLRIDSHERSCNLDAVLRYLQPTGIRVLVLEADRENRYKTWKDFENVDFYFVHDEDPVFHRTHYLNQLLQKCVTPVVAVWDADVILPYVQLEESLSMILNENAAIVLPYNQIVMYLSEEQTAACMEAESFQEHLKRFSGSYRRWLGRPSCGGLFLVNRKIYLKCGGENERFYGWGPEDAERIRRMEILGYHVNVNTQGPLYHLWHPRGENSIFFNRQIAFNNRLELIRICSMSTTELTDDIMSWECRINECNQKKGFDN